MTLAADLRAANNMGDFSCSACLASPALAKAWVLIILMAVCGVWAGD